MSASEWMLIVLGAWAGSYALRIAPFLSRQLYDLGRENLRFLTYVTFAIAAGIVSKSIVFSAGTQIAVGDSAIKLTAVLAALGLYKVLGNLPIALFSGAGLAVLLKWLAT